MATLAELKERLASIEEKIENGVESYSIVGSHSVKHQSMEDLQKQAALLRKRIFRWQGYTGRTHPDFSEGGKVADETY
jgi:hypothetical protein